MRRALVRMVLEGAREGKAKESVQKGFVGVFITCGGGGRGWSLIKKHKGNFTFLNRKTSSIRELKMLCDVKLRRKITLLIGWKEKIRQEKKEQHELPSY